MAKVGTVEIESVIILEMACSKIESSLSSSLENVIALELDKLKTLKCDSEILVKSSVDSISCTMPSDDTKLGNGKELDPQPLSLESGTGGMSPASDETEDMEMLSGCQTPDEGIFDPFAPGAEEMVLAPNPKKKIPRATIIPLRRLLNFDLCDSVKEKESVPMDKEDPLLGSICKSFLELIISNQIKEVSEYLKDDLAEGPKTPISVPFLRGIADTCPAAPMRPVLKSRRLNEGICRKLDFGGNLM